MELRGLVASDRGDIRTALAAEGWTPEQIEGQIETLNALAGSQAGLVAVAVGDENALEGYVCAQFYVWNRLAQIHGLAVIAGSRRQGVGSRLVAEAEIWARAGGARGLFVDTPVNNDAARAFYVATGYEESYRMPRYYADDLDGVTFSKFFG